MTIDATGGNVGAAPGTGQIPMPETIRHALAQLQGRLPRVPKRDRAEISTAKGPYGYNYADLADVTYRLGPIMSELGLSFTCLPTLMFDEQHPELQPRFVLEYTLWHVTGDFMTGMYPLPMGAGPQQIGSAITYGRRQCLCAVTGVAPEDDDDAAAAEAGLRQQARQPQQAREQGQERKLRSAGKKDAEPPAEPVKPAQPLADLAAKIAHDADKTLADLEEQVQKVATAKRWLTAPVADPVTGDKTSLSNVIAAARAHMQAAANEREAGDG